MTWRRRGEAVERRLLVPPERGSELALDALRLEPDASLDLTDGLHDTLLFAHTGTGSLGGEPLAGAAAGFVPTGQARTLTAGPDGLACVRATLGAATDLHAPMGPVEPVVALDHVEPRPGDGRALVPGALRPAQRVARARRCSSATSRPARRRGTTTSTTRSSGSCAGAGRLHIGETIEALGAGVAFRLRPRRGAHRREHAATTASSTMHRHLHARRQPVGRVPRAATSRARTSSQARQHDFGPAHPRPPAHRLRAARRVRGRPRGAGTTLLRVELDEGEPLPGLEAGTRSSPWAAR